MCDISKSKSSSKWTNSAVGRCFFLFQKRGPVRAKEPVRAFKVFGQNGWEPGSNLSSRPHSGWSLEKSVSASTFGEPRTEIQERLYQSRHFEIGFLVISWVIDVSYWHVPTVLSGFTVDRCFVWSEASTTHFAFAYNPSAPRQICVICFQNQALWEVNMIGVHFFGDLLARGIASVHGLGMFRSTLLFPLLSSRIKSHSLQTLEAAEFTRIFSSEKTERYAMLQGGGWLVLWANSCESVAFVSHSSSGCTNMYIPIFLRTSSEQPKQHGFWV